MAAARVFSKRISNHETNSKTKNAIITTREPRALHQAASSCRLPAILHAFEAKANPMIMKAKAVRTPFPIQWWENAEASACLKEGASSEATTIAASSHELAIIPA